jgi:hypothetical protein
LKTFAKLDDYDILSAIKDWISHEDEILSSLSRMLINRELLRIEISQTSMSDKEFEQLKVSKQKELGLSSEALSYFVFKDSIQNQAYDSSKSKINIYFKNGDIVDITEASDQLNLQALTKPVVKYFVCYPKK